MNPFDAYFYPIFGLACLVSTTMTFLAARKRGTLVPGMLFGLGVLSFWIGLFVGSDLGYRAWQAMPDPPPDAFTDTLPLGALLAGWIPGSIFCGLIFSVLRLILFFSSATSAVEQTNQSMAEPPDSGNPYQSPN